MENDKCSKGSNKRCQQTQGIFFAPNLKSAIRNREKIGKKEGVIYKKPQLSKKQINHIDGYKTYTSCIEKRRKRKKQK